MGIEIERKFLLKTDEWKAHVTETHVIKQGYLQSGLDKTQRSSVRIRISNKQANINVKSVELTAVRQEFEYTIPLHDAEQMLATLCSDVVIEKTRFYVPYESHLWEVDVFAGENKGQQNIAGVACHQCVQIGQADTDIRCTQRRQPGQPVRGLYQCQRQ